MERLRSVSLDCEHCKISRLLSGGHKLDTKISAFTFNIVGNKNKHEVFFGNAI